MDIEKGLMEMILEDIAKFGHKSAGRITLTFGPGVVKLLPVVDLISDNGKQALEEIRSFVAQPTVAFPESSVDTDSLLADSLLTKYGVISRSGSIKALRNPLNLIDFPSLSPKKSIEEIVADVVIILKAWVKTPFASCAYKVFCDYTGAEELEIEQFLESWIPDGNVHRDVLDSYASNDEYVILKEQALSRYNGIGPYHVFRKTEYLTARQAAIEAACKERERLAQEAESAAKAAQFEEEIRRSAYQTYVYLMEDLRNGLIKIGRSQNPEKREKTLQSEAPTVAMRFAIPADDSLEAQLHEKYDEFRKRGEWFILSPGQIREILDTLLSSGDSARVITNHEWIGKTFLAERAIGV